MTTQPGHCQRETLLFANLSEYPICWPIDGNEKTGKPPQRCSVMAWVRINQVFSHELCAALPLVLAEINGGLAQANDVS
jgi:hypothetical protein